MEILRKVIPGRRFKKISDIKPREWSMNRIEDEEENEDECKSEGSEKAGLTPEVVCCLMFGVIR